jgi:hypothetical protein
MVTVKLVVHLKLQHLIVKAAWPIHVMKDRSYWQMKLIAKIVLIMKELKAMHDNVDLILVQQLKRF